MTNNTTYTQSSQATTHDPHAHIPKMKLHVDIPEGHPNHPDMSNVKGRSPEVPPTQEELDRLSAVWYQIVDVFMTFGHRYKEEPKIMRYNEVYLKVMGILGDRLFDDAIQSSEFRTRFVNIWNTISGLNIENFYKEHKYETLEGQEELTEQLEQVAVANASLCQSNKDLRVAYCKLWNHFQDYKKAHGDEYSAKKDPETGEPLPEDEMSYKTESKVDSSNQDDEVLEVLKQFRELLDSDKSNDFINLMKELKNNNQKQPEDSGMNIPNAIGCAIGGISIGALGLKLYDIFRSRGGLDEKTYQYTARLAGLTSIGGSIGKSFAKGLISKLVF